MRKALLPLLLLLFLLRLPAQETLSFPGGLSYDPFYAVELTDSEGQRFRILNARYLTDQGEDKYFVWFRRGTDRGIAEYPLDLYKVIRLELTGNYEIFPDGYTPCTARLSSGQEFEGFLDTSGYLAGTDEEFGTYVRVYLQYNGIKSIEFIHDGRYKNCPFCGALYYNSDLEACPFDKTPLEQQNP